MSPRTRKTLQAVVGIGLAVALLVWGLPYFAKTTWVDIWDVIETIPLSQKRGIVIHYRGVVTDIDDGLASYKADAVYHVGKNWAKAASVVGCMEKASALRWRYISSGSTAPSREYP